MGIGDKPPVADLYERDANSSLHVVGIAGTVHECEREIGIYDGRVGPVDANLALPLNESASGEILKQPNIERPDCVLAINAKWRTGRNQDGIISVQSHDAIEVSFVDGLHCLLGNLSDFFRCPCPRQRRHSTQDEEQGQRSGTFHGNPPRSVISSEVSARDEYSLRVIKARAARRGPGARRSLPSQRRGPRDGRDRRDVTSSWAQWPVGPTPARGSVMASRQPS